MKVIDLTHIINEKMPVYPGTDKPKLTPANTYKKDGFKEDDIVFDVTGGQKVIAIAGAMFAIPNDRHLQYVSTNDYSVRHYDLIYSQSEE